MRLSTASAFAMLCLAAATIVDAALISFTQPVDPDASYDAGDSVIVRWNVDGSNNTVDVNTITGTLNLGKSNSKDLVEIQSTIATLNNTALQSGTYTWSIPSTLATSNQYSLIMEVGSTSFYTGKFNIVGSVAGTNSTGTSTGAASTTEASLLLTIPAVLVAVVGQRFC